MLRRRDCCGLGGVDVAFWDNLEKYTVRRSFVLFWNPVCQGVIGFICGLTEHPKAFFSSFFFRPILKMYHITTNCNLMSSFSSWSCKLLLRVTVRVSGFIFFNYFSVFFFKELHLGFFFFIVMNAQTQIHKIGSQLNKQQVWHVRTIVLEWDVSCKMYP